MASLPHNQPQGRKSSPSSPSKRFHLGTSGGRPTSPNVGKAGSQRLRPTRVSTASATPLSARSAVKKASMSSSTTLLDHDKSQDSSGETASLMEDLRERLKQAEETCQEVKRQNDALHARLDDATTEQAKLEERVHEDDERIEELENQRKEAIKQKREIETIYEAERAAIIKDGDAASAREEELQAIIQRLKDSLSQKDVAKGKQEADPSRNGGLSPSASSTVDANRFAPSNLVGSSTARNSSKILLQKDKVIEELRLELAELQIKLMELENQGGDRLQDLEKALMETRVTNARLMEENESFQTLLMEKTLNGDFTSQKPTAAAHQDNHFSARGASLADELASVAEDDTEQEGPAAPESIHRLELEIERQRIENKALSLYINKIIERILQHQGGFETILSTNDDEMTAIHPQSLPPAVNQQKDLPSLPSLPKESSEPEATEPQSLLQRAKSIAYGASSNPRPQRPESIMIVPLAASSVFGEADRATRRPSLRKPSQRHSMVPMRRLHTSSEYNPDAASIVNSMYRGRSEDSRPISPGIGSLRPSSVFGRASSGLRVPPSIGPFNVTDTDQERRQSSSTESLDDSSAESARKAALDALNGESNPASINDPPEDPSPPRSLASSKNDDRQVLSGNKIRPLRLVAEEQQQQQQKKANRNSWLPNNLSNWFGGTASPAGQSSSGSSFQAQQQP